VAADATVAAGTAQIVTSFVPLPGFSHETLVRVVGDWQVDGVGINGQVVLGGLVVTDAAFTAGAASIPDPVTEVSDDVWAFISSISIGTLPRGVGAGDHVMFDSKAMRKVDEGSRLVIMISNNTAGNIGFAMYMRVLSKVAIRS